MVVIQSRGASVDQARTGLVDARAPRPRRLAEGSGATSSGASPIRKQQATSTPIGASMLSGDSCACRACSDRALPRKTAP